MKVVCPHCGKEFEADNACVLGNLYAGESIAECPPERLPPGGHAVVEFEPSPERHFDALFMKDVADVEDAECYQDVDAPHDLADQLGSYVISYRTRKRTIRVHLFGDAGLTAWVTKDSYVTMREAQAFVRRVTLAMAGAGATVNRTVYDPDSLGRR